MTQEEAFSQSLGKTWDEMDRLGIRTARVRKQAAEHGTVSTVKRCLRGTQVSDGFRELTLKRRLNLSLEAQVLDRRWGTLFTDEEANEAIARLLEAGYQFLSR